MSVAHLLFVRDFEAEIDAERRQEERRARAHSAEELALAAVAARAEGHAAGLAEGLAQGRDAALAGIEAQRQELLDRLAQVIGGLAADSLAHRQQLEQDMTGFAADLADRILPELVDQLGPTRAEAEIGRVLRRSIGSPTLDIRLAPARAQALAADVPALEARSGQTIRLVPDPSLDPSEVVGNWQHGRSRYSFAAICRAIRAMIRRAAQTPPPSDQAGSHHD